MRVFGIIKPWTFSYGARESTRKGGTKPIDIDPLLRSEGWLHGPDRREGYPMHAKRAADVVSRRTTGQDFATRKLGTNP